MPPFNPDPHGSPAFRPQHPVRLSDLRQIAEQSRQMMRSAVTGGISDTGGGTGFQVGEELLPEGFWARLTAQPVSLSQPYYSWIEVQDDGTGQGWTTPNGAIVSLASAVEQNNNVNIDVPGAPTVILGTSAGGSLPSIPIYYVVTATWQNAAGQRFQGPLSNEVSGTGQGGWTANLTWTTPTYSLNNPPAIWAGATVQQWAIVNYQIWRGESPGGEDVLVATVDNLTHSYADTGGAGSVQTPIPGGTAGPVVWMSPRSAWDYYKFYFPPDPLLLAWIKATSTTPVLVKLFDGGVLQVFRAVLDGFSDYSGTWSDGTVCWWYEVNGQYPQQGGRYQCRLLAMDTCGIPVWGTEQILGNTTTTAAPTATTTTIAPCTGTCYWVWSTGTNSWTLQINGCVTGNTTTTTTSTTTPTPGTTTCNAIVTTTSTTTTTTTAAPLTCGCVPPNYCGTFSGECTITNCATGLLPPSPNCNSTTTTTTTPTTTTMSPGCSTTLGPGCNQCCWVNNGLGWLPTTFCSGNNCFCPGSSPPISGNCGDIYCYSCYATTPPPPGQCLGGCYWMWVAPPGQWVFSGGGCFTTSTNVCGPCACSYPTIIGAECLEVTSTPCLFQCPGPPPPGICPCYPCPSTTTTVNPCGPGCYWQWNGSAWINLQNNCISPCNCCAPGYNGTHSCETAQTGCFNPPICLTTTTTSTTAAPTTTTTQAPCGNCTYIFSGSCQLVQAINGCTGSCGCLTVPTCPEGGGTVQIACGTTTTTAAPCGTCTYVLGPCSVGGGGITVCIMTLTNRTCTGSCGCCNSGCATPGQPGQVITINCSLSSPCATTTTPAPNYCVWYACGAPGGWCLIQNNCSAGQQCTYPASPSNQCCGCSAMTPCSGTTTAAPTTTTTTTTTTTVAPTCGTCTYRWDGSVWKIYQMNCTGACGCVAPVGSGSFVGQTQVDNCA